MLHLCEIAKTHDDQSEGLNRRSMIEKVIQASGHKLSYEQAQQTWDRTIRPLG